MHTRWAGGFLGVALALAGCAAPPQPAPVPEPPGSAAITPVPVRVPADGRLLRGFGYSFGPLDSFSLPRGARLATAVDQADNVTAVVAAPAAGEVAAYLRRALPAAGYTVTGDVGTSALTFRGHGWSGSFTGDRAVSAVLLRPA